MSLPQIGLAAQEDDSSVHEDLPDFQEQTEEQIPPGIIRLNKRIVPDPNYVYELPSTTLVQPHQPVVISDNMPTRVLSPVPPPKVILKSNKMRQAFPQNVANSTRTYKLISTNEPELDRRQVAQQVEVERSEMPPIQQHYVEPQWISESRGRRAPMMNRLPSNLRPQSVPGEVYYEAMPQQYIMDEIRPVISTQASSRVPSQPSSRLPTSHTSQLSSRIPSQLVSQHTSRLPSQISSQQPSRYASTTQLSRPTVDLDAEPIEIIPTVPPCNIRLRQQIPVQTTSTNDLYESVDTEPLRQVQFDPRVRVEEAIVEQPEQEFYEAPLGDVSRTRSGRLIRPYELKM